MSVGVQTPWLIEAAAKLLKPHVVADRIFGDVSAVLVTEQGNHYSGVAIDTASATGFCAEHAAVAAMVTAAEYRIARVVAVWRDDADDRLYVLAPCGRCREFMYQVDASNIAGQVVLGPEESKELRELLPLHEWSEPLPSN